MRLREIAVPGSQAGLVLHHLSNALGADPSTNEWAVIVMRAMVQQARGILSGIPPELFQSLPYVMTILVLVLVSSSGAKRRLGAPGSLGVPYVREER